MFKDPNKQIALTLGQNYWPGGQVDIVATKPVEVWCNEVLLAVGQTVKFRLAQHLQVKVVGPSGCKAFATCVVKQTVEPEGRIHTSIDKNPGWSVDQTRIAAAARSAEEAFKREQAAIKSAAEIEAAAQKAAAEAEEKEAVAQAHRERVIQAQAEALQAKEAAMKAFEEEQKKKLLPGDDESKMTEEEKAGSQAGDPPAS